MNILVRPRVNVDVLAQRLMHLGRVAAAMPPLWDGDRHAPLIAGPQGEYLGRVLPGKGIKVAFDLRDVGINRALPYVFERSPLLHLLDTLRDERGAVTTYATQVLARQNLKYGPRFNIINKGNVSFAGNAGWYHLFRMTGTPAGGSYANIPGGGTFNNASTGSFLGGVADPTGGDKTYLFSIAYGAGGSMTINTLILIDLLMGASNIDSNSNAAQTVNSTALTRYTSGSGVLMGCETITSNLGTTPSNLTVTKYTNQGGATLQATPAQALQTSAAAFKNATTALGPFLQLQAGDYGVQSIEEVQLSAAMGTASRPLCMYLYYTLCWVPGIDIDTGREYDLMGTVAGAKEIVTEAGGTLGCLDAILWNNGGGPSSLIVYNVTVGTG